MLQQYHEAFLRIKFQLTYYGKLIGLGLVLQFLAFISVIVMLNIQLPVEEFYILKVG